MLIFSLYDYDLIYQVSHISKESKYNYLYIYIIYIYTQIVSRISTLFDTIIEYTLQQT